MQVGSAGDTIMVNRSANLITRVDASMISSYSPSKSLGNVIKYPAIANIRKTPINFKESEKN